MVFTGLKPRAVFVRAFSSAVGAWILGGGRGTGPGVFAWPRKFWGRPAFSGGLSGRSGWDDGFHGVDTPCCFRSSLQLGSGRLDFGGAEEGQAPGYSHGPGNFGGDQRFRAAFQDAPGGMMVFTGLKPRAVFVRAFSSAVGAWILGGRKRDRPRGIRMVREILGPTNVFGRPFRTLGVG